MKTLRIALNCGVAFAVLLSGAGLAQDNVEAVRSLVVRLRIHRAGQADETAAGLFVGKDQQSAYFITAYHSIRASGEGSPASIQLQFYSSPQNFTALALENYDEALDLAVVSTAVSNLPPNLPEMPRTDPTVVPITIVGHPAGSAWTAWPGTVENENAGVTDIRHFITNRDDTLAGGFSGGPVIDSTGAFLGMHTSNDRRYGFAAKSADIVSQLRAWRVPRSNLIEPVAGVRTRKPSISELRCPRDPQGQIDLSKATSDSAIRCHIAGEGLDRVAKLRLRNSRDVTDPARPEGIVTIGTDNTAGEVTFEALELKAVPGDSYNVYAVDANGTEIATAQQLYLDKRKVAQAEWHALPPLGKSVVGLAIFNGRLFAATDRGGVFRYDESNSAWEDTGGPLKGRALRSLESFGVYLMAGSDDYATKKAGWSLMGDDYKWRDMGLTGRVVQSIRGDHIYLHYGTYGAYLKGRGNDPPVINNSGFPGTPYINAVEPTDRGLFAGLGPSNDPRDGTGLWFLPKDGNRWLAVKGVEEEDIHSLAANGRYVFAGTTTDGVFRVNTGGSHSENLSNGLPKGQVVNKLAARENSIFAGTLGAGVFGSSDNGEHWVDFNDSQTRSENITSLLVANENTAYAGTSSGKLFVTTLPVIAAAVTPPPPSRDLWPLWSMSSQILVIPERNKIYIADARDEKQGGILVADLNDAREGRTPMSRIPIGSVGYEGAVGRPVRMLLDPHALDPNTKRPFLYIADARQSKVHVVDINRNVVVGYGFPVGRSPNHLAITPDGRELFVSNEQPAPNGTISILDVSRLSVDAPNDFKLLQEIQNVGCPEGLAMSPSGQELYAASQCGGGRDPVFVIDTEQLKVVDSIPGLDVGGNLALSKDGKTLYVGRTNASCRKPDGEQGSPLSVVNIQSRSIVNTVCLQVGVDLVALSHDDAYLFVSNGNNLSVFDTRQVVAAGNAALLNDITVKSDNEAAMEGIGVADEGGVYVWIPNTPGNTPPQPRLFMYNPSGLIKPTRFK